MSVNSAQINQIRDAIGDAMGNVSRCKVNAGTLNESIDYASKQIRDASDSFDDMVSRMQSGEVIDSGEIEHVLSNLKRRVDVMNDATYGIGDGIAAIQSSLTDVDHCASDVASATRAI